MGFAAHVLLMPGMLITKERHTKLGVGHVVHYFPREVHVGGE